MVTDMNIIDNTHGEKLINCLRPQCNEIMIAGKEIACPECNRGGHECPLKCIRIRLLEYDTYQNHIWHLNALIFGECIQPKWHSNVPLLECHEMQM